MKPLSLRMCPSSYRLQPDTNKTDACPYYDRYGYVAPKTDAVSNKPDALVVLRMKRGSQRIRRELIRMDLRDELVGISFKRGGS